MIITNLTPHDINIVQEDGQTKTIFRSGKVARVSQNQTKKFVDDGITFYESTFGEVQDLPPEIEGNLYIVSSIVKAAAPERKDLVVPCNFVRNAGGQITGAGGLSF